MRESNSAEDLLQSVISAESGHAPTSVQLVESKVRVRVAGCMPELCVGNAQVRERADKARPVVKQVKLLRNADKVDAAGKQASKGLAFVEFGDHEHALCALRQLNNNPAPFGARAGILYIAGCRGEVTVGMRFAQGFKTYFFFPAKSCFVNVQCSLWMISIGCGYSANMAEGLQSLRTSTKEEGLQRLLASIK